MAAVLIASFPYDEWLPPCGAGGAVESDDPSDVSMREAPLLITNDEYGIDGTSFSVDVTGTECFVPIVSRTLRR